MRSEDASSVPRLFLAVPSVQMAWMPPSRDKRGSLRVMPETLLLAEPAHHSGTFTRALGMAGIFLLGKLLHRQRLTGQLICSSGATASPFAARGQRSRPLDDERFHHRWRVYGRHECMPECRATEKRQTGMRAEPEHVWVLPAAPSGGVAGMARRKAFRVPAGANLLLQARYGMNPAKGAAIGLPAATAFRMPYVRLLARYAEVSIFQVTFVMLMEIYIY